MKKLEGNGLWASSRMMLPEHKEAINREWYAKKSKPHPELDAQEIELIERVLAGSFRERRKIRLRVWGEYEDEELCGVVTTVQTYLREIKLTTEPGEWQWVRLTDILSADWLSTTK